MGHEVDLSKYEIRTDLIVDTEYDGFSDKKVFGDIEVSSVSLKENDASLLSKKPGDYITISFNDVTDSYNRDKLIDVFSSEFKELLVKKNLSIDSSCLVVGLGNEKSTPDLIGPCTVDNLIITNHLYEISSLDSGFRRVCAINPGVMGTTGIETSDIVLSVVSSVKPDFLIVIDALASSSLDRVNKTIQITDTGIHPGSGIGNNRREISFDTIGIPVIAIGIPTVVDVTTIVSNTIDYMVKYFSYTKINIDNPINKLIVRGDINYLNKDIDVNSSDRNELLGLVGSLNDSEIRSLVYEVLSPVGYNFMVTPKEIDFVIKNLCYVLSNGLNKALHEKVI